jgi:DnaJ-class molecular chaperone
MTSPCDKCHGSGRIDCEKCQGRSIIEEEYYDSHYEEYLVRNIACPSCNGKGKLECWKCAGTGSYTWFEENDY